MKRTFFFCCVIGLAACANAALTFECDPELWNMVAPGVYDVSVMNDGASVYYIAVGLYPNGAYDLVNVVYPPDWVFQDYGYNAFDDGFHYWDLSCVTPVPSYVNGELLRMTFSFPQVVSDFKIYLFNETFDIMDARAFVVAPEPATMLLLALGGLLIRKR